MLEEYLEDGNRIEEDMQVKEPLSYGLYAHFYPFHGGFEQIIERIIV